MKYKFCSIRLYVTKYDVTFSTNTVLEKLLWIFYFFNNFDAIFLVT